MDNKKILKIMQFLKVEDVTIPICRTPRGDLGQRVHKDGRWEFTLDAVPVDPELNSIIREILWPKEN